MDIKRVYCPVCNSKTRSAFRKDTRSSRVQAPAHGIGALFRQRRSLRFSPGSLPRALCGIAQEVEQRPYKPCVMGSIPIPTTTPPVVYRA